MIRGTLSGMRKGTIFGREGIGSVEEIGKGIRTSSPGDCVVILSTRGRGNCPTVVPVIMRSAIMQI